MVYDISNPYVSKLLQEALKSRSLYEGAIDGDFGPGSKAAFLRYVFIIRYQDVGSITLTLTDDQTSELATFKARYLTNQARYAAVAALTDTPPELIAAIHWREGSGDFSTYLHNGDPLGKKVTDEPLDVPIFNTWEPAAVDAIKRETTARSASGVTRQATLAQMCAFAECFNGLGYVNRGVPDPYVLSGTSGYRSGKYVSDGVYSSSAVDGQLGVLAMLHAILVSA